MYYFMLFRAKAATWKSCGLPEEMKRTIFIDIAALLSDVWADVTPSIMRWWKFILPKSSTPGGRLGMQAFAQRSGVQLPLTINGQH